MVVDGQRAEFRSLGRPEDDRASVHGEVHREDFWTPVDGHRQPADLLAAEQIPADLGLEFDDPQRSVSDHAASLPTDRRPATVTLVLNTRCGYAKRCCPAQWPSATRPAAVTDDGAAMYAVPAQLIVRFPAGDVSPAASWKWSGRG